MCLLWNKKSCVRCGLQTAGCLCRPCSGNLWKRKRNSSASTFWLRSKADPGWETVPGASGFSLGYSSNASCNSLCNELGGVWSSWLKFTSLAIETSFVVLGEWLWMLLSPASWALNREWGKKGHKLNELYWHSLLKMACWLWLCSFHSSVYCQNQWCSAQRLQSPTPKLLSQGFPSNIVVS